MMDLQAKLIVTFVWGIIAFETTSYLYLYSPLLYEYVCQQSLRTSLSSCSSSQSSSLLFRYFVSVITSPYIVSRAIAIIMWYGLALF